ncbi:TniB family NTP-binding protein [Dethiobacter alkaliphilus]|uniref:TniB family NTP-binding protein n=1 Tax=Dethiobacter alkaliphilus TaxID=427926 RepID=UPI002227F053|nr:TniB family NTP-binding protein [Dethiobacter alkaliphilus]MCW3491344.1 TniB family NTP-binding protein [Dethiobacter alkaliphilus]
MKESAASSIVSPISNLSLRETEDLKNLSVSQRYKYIKDLVITHPKMDEILNAVSECHRNSLSGIEPECMSIFGPTRVGKSTIAKQYLNRNRSYNTNRNIGTGPNEVLMPASVTCIPVLYTVVECPAAIGGVVSSMLEGLGHPMSSMRMSIHDKTAQLKILIQNCGVELIILDEVQHFVDREKKKLLLESSDWLKTLIINLNIPIILMGTLEAEKIFTNQQLNGRFLNRYNLLPFNYDNETERTDFRMLLQIIDDNLPLLEESSLGDTEMYKPIYLATGGRIALVMELIKRSTLLALNNNLEAITAEIMSAIYKKHLYRLGYCQGNPFDPTYDIEGALDRINWETYITDLYDNQTNNRSKRKKENQPYGFLSQ